MLEFKLPWAIRGQRLVESFRRVQADLDVLPIRLSELGKDLEVLRRDAGRWAAALKQSGDATARRPGTISSRALLLRVLHAYILPIDSSRK